MSSLLRSARYTYKVWNLEEMNRSVYNDPMFLSRLLRSDVRDVFLPQLLLDVVRENAGHADSVAAWVEARDALVAGDPGLVGGDHRDQPIKVRGRALLYALGILLHMQERAVLAALVVELLVRLHKRTGHARNEPYASGEGRVEREEVKRHARLSKS